MQKRAVCIVRGKTSIASLAEYIRLNSEDNSLWESFPQILQSLDGAKRYVDAFRAPLQGLTMMKDQQVHHPEGLLPSGDPAIRGEDASPRRLPEGPLRDELNKLGWPHSGCGPGHEGSTS